jgi:hypothetical protein
MLFAKGRSAPQFIQFCCGRLLLLRGPGGDACVQSRAWREDFNDRRPHGLLGDQPPSEFARRCAAFAKVAALQPIP